MSRQPDAYEDDDHRPRRHLLALDSPQRHNFHAVGDEDWLKFDALASTTYSIQTSELASNADTYVYLYDTDGTTLLASNDDAGDALASYLEWTAPSTGTYYVRVRNWNPNVGGCGTGYAVAVLDYSQAPLPAAIADLALAKSPADAILAWTHTDPVATHYQVYRSENPYFTPGHGDSVKLEPDVPAPTAGTQVSYPGSAMCPGVDAPCYYAVVAVSKFGKVSSPSNRVGLFAFNLQPGGDPPPGTLLNGGFENGSTMPTVWATDAWASGRTTFTWDSTQPRSGRWSIKIASNEEDDARWIQSVVVEPNTAYRLSGCIKTENVVHRADGTDAGANLSLLGGWTRMRGIRHLGLDLP